MKDLTDMRFGKLTVLRRNPSNKNGYATWVCLCDCGNECVVISSNLTTGRTQSCGCLHKERFTTTTHGYSNTPVYKLRENMISRCYNKKHRAFRYYGGRGIRVCDEWLDHPERFCEWAMSHGYGKGLQIDRIDNDGDYSPENCRFVTPKENTNNRRNTIYIQWNGERVLLTELITRTEIPYGFIRSRKELPFEEIEKLWADYIMAKNNKVIYYERPYDTSMEHDGISVDYGDYRIKYMPESEEFVIYSTWYNLRGVRTPRKAPLKLTRSNHTYRLTIDGQTEYFSNERLLKILVKHLVEV